MGKKTRLTLQILVVSLFVMLTTVFLFTDSFGFRQTAATTDTAELEDGYYVGSDNGYGGELKVELEVENGEISELAVLEHGESEGVSDAAFEEIPEEIINKNSTEVDTVSGATMTSEGLIGAANDALSNEPNESSEVTDDSEDREADSNEDVEEDTEEEPEEDKEIEAMTFDVEDGTYEGTAEAHNGPLTVEVSVEDKEITNIVIIDHEETEGVSDPAFEEIPANIMDYQSTEVDLISGATVTSEAIVEAVTNALED